MGRSSRSDDGPPTIPLLHHGCRLSLEEFELAYNTLEDVIIFQVMGDSNESRGYAIGRITKFFPCEDTGAHVELTYLGARMSFTGGTLRRRVSPEACRRILLITFAACTRKEGER